MSDSDEVRRSTQKGRVQHVLMRINPQIRRKRLARLANAPPAASTEPAPPVTIPPAAIVKPAQPAPTAKPEPSPPRRKPTHDEPDAMQVDERPAIQVSHQSAHDLLKRIFGVTIDVRALLLLRIAVV